jgi:hypothetical protein
MDQVPRPYKNKCYITRCGAHDGKYKDYSNAVCDAVYIYRLVPMFREKLHTHFYSLRREAGGRSEMALGPNRLLS